MSLRAFPPPRLPASLIRLQILGLQLESKTHDVTEADTRYFRDVRCGCDAFRHGNNPVLLLLQMLLLLRTLPHRSLAIRPLLPLIQQTIHPSSYKAFGTSTILKMPEPLKASEVNSQTDPSVSKQWDDETPKDKQIDDFYKTVDGMKIGLLTTIREGLGPVSRSMAVAKVIITIHYSPSIQLG